MIKKGDHIRTPRFLSVRIDEVFENEEAARAAGFIEPTHYCDPAYGILGKPVGENRMVFAAYKNRKETGNEDKRTILFL